MKAMILAAGLGTRLRPWTLEHPKALFPVEDVPMIDRVLKRLQSFGFDQVVVNLHHFADQLQEHLASQPSGINITTVSEQEELLDTGGGILNAEYILATDDSPFLVHNADILSTADLKALMDRHIHSGADATLLVSNRHSSRKLWFDADMRLMGWENTITGETRPVGFTPTADMQDYAFSGIYVLSTSVFRLMHQRDYGKQFPIMDFFLDPRNYGVHSDLSTADIKGFADNNLMLVDIGKPDSLAGVDLSIFD